MPVELPHLQLDPLPYQIEVRDYLKASEPELWNWFASARAQEDYSETLRLELLKSTYRLDAQSHPALYTAVEEAKSRLDLDVPVTVYQAQNSPQTNATLYFISGQGHIVFCGPALSLLESEELKSVIGHELAHYILWQSAGGDFLIADRILQAVAHDPRALPSHQQTARRFQLYTEIFADRGSIQVTGELSPVVSGLVKIQTGLREVSAASYLKQADEIFARGEISTEGISHPETFIRARALRLWTEKPDSMPVQLSQMIEGEFGLDHLDLVGQGRLAEQSRKFLECFLAPKWFQTSATLGHASLFFPNFRPGAISVAYPFAELQLKDPKLREYFCYLLLDFATVDPDLDQLPLAAALETSRQMQMDDDFEKIAGRELKMKSRDLRKLKEQAEQMLATAGEGV